MNNQTSRVVMPQSKQNPYTVRDMVSVRDTNDLQTFLDTGLMELYRTVFGAPPYNEVFEDAEVIDIFNDYLQSNGDIMVLSERGRPISFMVGTPLKADFMTVCGIPANIPLAKMRYIAEDGVDVPYRRRGISTMMKGALLDQYASQGFEQAILSTSAANTPQIQAVLAAGGKTIIGAQQMVERTTKFGKVMEDNRFFRFDLTRR
jgi:hypothetical protein